LRKFTKTTEMNEENAAGHRPGATKDGCGARKVVAAGGRLIPAGVRDIGAGSGLAEPVRA
jgi:hypothetical protein